VNLHAIFKANRQQENQTKRDVKAKYRLAYYCQQISQSSARESKVSWCQGKWLTPHSPVRKTVPTFYLYLATVQLLMLIIVVVWTSHIKYFT
jgi:hypothetical protein